MNAYKLHRFPPDIISFAVWLYHRFSPSYRDVEDVLAERGITVSYESVRLWCIKFGPKIAKRLRRNHSGFGDTFYVDEVFVQIRGKRRHLGRAVDQDGDVVDVYLRDRRDARAVKRSFHRLLYRHGDAPWKVVTDKLGSYRVAHRESVPDSIHVTDRYANNRAEQSHEATRFRERGMREFKSEIQAQRFLDVHAARSNNFSLGRHLVKACHYQMLPDRAFASWKCAVEI